MADLRKGWDDTMTNLPTPRLIETSDCSGYYLSDIHDALTRKQREAFTEWFSGQTGMFHEGRKLIYKWDWEKFVAEQRRVQEAEATADESRY